MKNAIKTRCVGGSLGATFSLAIDSTKVSSGMEVSTQYKSIIGRAHSNHDISVTGLSLDEIKDILQQKGDFSNGEMATEVKVCIMSFQMVPQVYLHSRSFVLSHSQIMSALNSQIK